MKRALLSLLFIGASSATLAQAPTSPAQMGITPTTTPEVLQVLDSSKTWVPIGTVDQTTHTFADWLAVNLDPRTYGAKCDGAAHAGDDAAWASLTAAVTPGAFVFVPSKCVFTAPIAFPAVANLTISAPGFGGSLTYSGASTVDDLVTIGSSTGLDAQHCSVRGLKVRNVLFQSTVFMTGGDAVRVKYACDSDLNWNTFGGEFTGGNHFYNALHLDSGNSIRTVGGEINGSNTGALLNGDMTTQLTDPFFFHTKVTGAKYGFNIAGAVGGFQLAESSVIGNQTHVRISQDQVARQNYQVMLNHATLDATSGGAGVAIDLADPGGGNALLNVNQTWLASAGKQALLIESSAVNWKVTFSGGYVLNNNNAAAVPAAIDNESTALSMSLQFIGTQFSQCCNGGKYVIVNQLGNPAVILTDATFITSTANRFSGPTVGTWNDGANLFSIGPVGGVVVQGLGSTASDCGGWYSTTFFEPGKMDGGSTGCTLSLGSGGSPWADVQALQGHFFDTSTSSNANMVFSAANDTNGLNLKLIGNGATTPNKTIRVTGGVFQILNSAYTASLLTIDDVGSLRTGAFTVATLPACSGIQGTQAYVTDSAAVTASSYMQPVAAGGSTKVAVFCDGAGWKYH